MEASDFARGLQVLSPVDIHAVAAALEVWEQGTDHEVQAWQTVVAVDACLRRTRSTRLAATVATKAQVAVRHAASREADVAVQEDEVQRVARVAADIARGLVVGDALEAPVRSHLLAWASLFPAA